MRLRFSPTSPYVRKVSIVLLETGLDARVQKIATNPWDAETDLGASNPLGKVPALELPDGMVLYDSPVICEYLDTQHQGARLFPQGDVRWRALRWQALGDGTLDAAALTFIEQVRRPAQLRWAAWCERQRLAAGRALDCFVQELPGAGDGFDIGHIALVCALGYLDFRLPEWSWREGRAPLADWYAAMLERPTVAQTRPREPT